jgi:hypothetical protein
MTMEYPDMTPAKGAGRPSCLAMNPDNLAATARRRSQLLAAFETLPAPVRADLLEAVETIVFRANPGVDFERDDAREIIRRVYEIAGWERVT